MRFAGPLAETPRVVSPPVRARLSAVALAVLTAVLASLALQPAPAQAKSCTSDGGEKVCIAVLRESCSPGPPYRCRTARDEQHYRAGRFDYSQYQARRRICAGFGGTLCRLDYKTFCTTTRSSKRCRTDTGTSCRGGKVTRCVRTVDSCLTRKGYRCRYTKVEERCSNAICRTTRLICNSSSRRGKRCYSRFSKGPGRMSEDAARDEQDANLPFFEDDGSAPPPAPAPAPAPVTSTTTTTTTTTTSSTTTTTSGG